MIRAGINRRGAETRNHAGAGVGRAVARPIVVEAQGAAANRTSIAVTWTKFEEAEVRVGVVGCGYWGAKHVRVLQQIPAVSRVAVIDPRPDRLAEFAEPANGLQAFGDLGSAIPHVDAVVIAASACRLIEEAAHRGLTLMVGHTFEYNAAVWKLREVIESGELGRICYIDTARLNLGIYQADVNVLWDLAPHDVSIINYLLRTTPSSVHAWGSKHARFSQEDVAYLRLTYNETAVTAQVHVSWLDPCKVRRVTVVGSRKMAVYNDLADQDRLRIYDQGVVASAQDDPRNPPMSYRYGGIFSPYVPIQEPLRVQDEHFVECAQTGRRPRTDGESGLAVVQVLEAAGRSLRSGTATWLRDGEVDQDRADLVLAEAGQDFARSRT